MINKITKLGAGDVLWRSIIDDPFEVEKTHRKGSTFYATAFYEVSEKFFPDNPELWGFWMSDTLMWTDDDGLDEPSYLIRVEKKKRVIEEEYWDIVK